MSKEKEIAEEYASSLADLTVNSKPLINMLTILAEENVEHAGVIVDTVEKHLEKSQESKDKCGSSDTLRSSGTRAISSSQVQPDIKLPVLYLVDSIIKNVGGAYTTKFSQSIVNMFTRTFKQVDEKVRSQMFKLRETWHDVFPATKLYQLDVKVNLIDPAWPIQAQPHPGQSNIHVNPNFLKKSATPATSTVTAATVAPVISEEEKMRSILAKKEQELLMLQQKKIEMQLEQTRKALELAEKNAKKATAAVIPPAMATVTSNMPVAMVNPVVAPVIPGHVAPDVALPVKARLGPPVHKPSSRIAPVSGALAGARRDPRLARQQAAGRVPTVPQPPVSVPTVAAPVIPHIIAQPPIIAPNVFDIKPLDRATKRKNVITYEVQPDEVRSVNRSRRDPRLDKRSDERRERREKTRERRKNENHVERHKPDDVKRDEPRKEENNSHHIKKDEKLFNEKNSADKYFDKIADAKKINKLPPIPKLNREEARDKDAPSPVKRKKDVKIDKKKKKDSDSSKDSQSPVSSPEKKPKTIKEKEVRTKKPKPEKAEEKPDQEVVVFKGLKNYHKERYMRRNKEKSESPEPQKMETDAPVEDSSNVTEPVEAKDVDLRVLPTVLSTVEQKAAAVGQKRPSTETVEGKTKRNKIDKFDILFGNEDVDLRQLPQVEETIPHKSPKHKTDHEDRNPSPWEDRDLRVPQSQSPREDRDHRVLLSPPKEDQDRRVKVTTMEDRDLRIQVSPKEPQDRKVIISSKEDVDRRVKVTPMEDRDLRVQVLPRKDRDHRRQASPQEDEDHRPAVTSKDRDLRRPVSPDGDQEKAAVRPKDRNHRRQASPEEDQDRRVLVTPQPDPERSPKDAVQSSPREERNRILISPKKDWNEVKEKEEVKKTPSKLDLAKAKLHKATIFKDNKDRLGRPFLFSKSPSVEKERRRTISAEDLDLRTENPEEFDAEDHKKTINIIMNQAKEQFTDGQLDKNQYNTLMYQVLQLNEKLKLKEAKQRESLELSKRKLHKAAHLNKQRGVASPKSSPNAPNNFGDVDERVMPAAFMDAPPDSQGFMQDSDMRMNMMDTMDAPRPALLPIPGAPTMPGMYNNMPYGNWRGPRPRSDEYVPRRFRGPLPPPIFRPRFEKRVPRFEQRMPLQLPTPKIGMGQGECPLKPYERLETPPPLGAPGVFIPPTDFRIIEYIDHDPVKTIQIDGIPREIRYYGDTAIIMLDWDDPREIKFLPGCRRVTFDNKDSVVLNFNDPYKQVEIDDQVFDIKFGAPTRELFINGRWWECFFGGQPLGVIIDGKPRLVHLEGPLPQVDIGKEKRTDLVAGKVNLIVNATQMCPVYLDAKVQKFVVNGQFFTIRFVDALKTVLINEQPFQVTFGDLPKPITIGNEKFFIRFSALPRNVKPGYINIANMEGATIPALMPPVMPMPGMGVGMAPMSVNPMEVDEEIKRPPKTPSPEGESRGLDMLASVMPSNMEIEAPSSATEYCSAEPLFVRPDKIPGLETSPQEEKPTTSLPILGNINVTDLFAKLLATGIVQMPSEPKKEEKGEEKTEVVKPPPKEDKTKIHKVDLLRSETLKVKQPGLVAKLYGGMQCSGCGARFPPEHTVRYSQHLDWHFRQNRRERDSARRAHSRHWHYDLSDWVQYEEVEDLEEREKSWFETGGAEGEGEGPPEVPEETPSVAAGAPADHHCALCGDKFDQFYNEDKEEWHLRNSVRHEEKNYHPMCFEDYKASLTKEEEKKEVEVVSLDKEEEEEPIAIDADEINSQSDNESVVEVVEPEEKPVEPPVEIDEGEEDDVVLKAEPIEEVEVKDDVDTDDELAEERRERDRQAEIDFSKVKIKQEPIDPDDEPIITAEEDSVAPTVDTTHTTVLSSIDGNVQLAAPAPTSNASMGIRINISKTIQAQPITSLVTTTNSAMPEDRSLEDISEDDQPLPPGEESELDYTLKPGLEGVSFSRQPPVMKGNELSGLCSIM